MSVQKQISPSSPSRSASACMSVAEKIYDMYGHSSFSAAEAASAAGLSATSGTFKGLFSDLKQYDLIEKTGPSSFRVTQGVKDYTLALSENSEQIHALRYDFVRKPEFFRKLIDSLHGKIPDIIPLANILMSQHQFNKRKAHDTAKALSDSLEWATVLDDRRNLVPPRPENTEKREQLSQEPAAGSAMPDDPCLEPSNTERLTMQLPLAGGRVIQIVYPPDLSKKEAAMVGAVLQAIDLDD